MEKSNETQANPGPKIVVLFSILPLGAKEDQLGEVFQKLLD